MPRVSVIIAAYNHERFIGPAIQSVLNQTLQDIELIVTDDCSTDGTLAEIRKFSDPRLKVFAFERNCGAAVAMNHSLAHATGDYIAPMGSDDLFHPHKLERQVAYLDAQPEMLAVTAQPEFIDENGHAVTSEDHHFAKAFTRENRSREAWLREFFVSGNCLCQPAALVRRSLHDRIGGFHPMLQQLWDFDFWVRLVMQGPLHILPETLISYRVRSDGGNVSAASPQVVSTHLGEYYQILHRYLEPVVLEHLHDIFGPDYSGLTQPAAARLALAEIAWNAGSPPHRLFASQLLLDTPLDGLEDSLQHQVINRARTWMREADSFGIREAHQVQVHVRNLEAHSRHLESRASDLETHARDLEAQNRHASEVWLALQERVASQQASLESLRSEKARLKTRLEATISKLDRTRENNTSMQHSLSWKLTRPLRAFQRLFRSQPPALPPPSKESAPKEEVG